jgi:hypothetical protein
MGKQGHETGRWDPNDTSRPTPPLSGTGHQVHILPRTWTVRRTFAACTEQDDRRQYRCNLGRVIPTNVKLACHLAVSFGQSNACISCSRLKADASADECHSPSKREYWCPVIHPCRPTHPISAHVRAHIRARSHTRDNQSSHPSAVQQGRGALQKNIFTTS